VAVECIHGFEAGLCDICFPKAPPTPKRASVVRPPRATTRARAQRAGQPTRLSSKSPPANINNARVYHLTHVRNLEQILEIGQLRSAQSAVAGESAHGAVAEPSAGVAAWLPAIDLSSQLTRELRATAEVRPGLSVSQCVPFFLSPNAELWNELRSGVVESTRWSDAARAATSTDFVMLVTTIGALGADAAIADDDAAGTFTRFSGQPDDRTRLLSRLSPEQLLRAEVLAPGIVELSRVQLIGVANDPMRERVRGMLIAVALGRSDTTQPKVAVYPPWFQRE